MCRTWRTAQSRSCPAASRRACCVARALAQESGVLIADEPTAGLDPAHGLGLFATFQRLAAEGRAVVIALHDLTLAARFCHHVVLLVAGRVAAAGPAADVLVPEPLSAAFGVSMARGLIEEVPVVLPRCASAMSVRGSAAGGGKRVFGFRSKSIRHQSRAAGRRRARRVHVGRHRPPARGEPPAVRLGQRDQRRRRQCRGAAPRPCRGRQGGARDKLRSVWEAVHEAGVPDLLRLNPFLYGMSRSAPMGQVARPVLALRVQSAGLRSAAACCSRPTSISSSLRALPASSC